MTNVLVDRHHAGLYRSLQLLGDRLGWTLYTPVGLDWMTERYWSFGMNQPGLTDDLAQQYLVPHKGVWSETFQDGFDGRPVECYVTGDPEFPAVDIWGVTLEQARRMEFSHVIATLSDNQWGFRRFAQEVGAQYVVQVGNTNQYVDWSLDPLALVSSEVPIRGRGVVYHQEMDADASEWSDPLGWTYNGHAQRVIGSYVNCFPSIGACYDLWLEMQRLMPDWTFDEHGIDGRDGVSKPLRETTARMARASFGWHDKVHGDGYGHVIHMWAAVGRPLIGHGSHYAGKMAHPFWQHGVTAIDLDVVSIPEAAAMVRDIAADPELHAEMCRAIRAVYDELVDHDAEEQAIRELLGLPVAVPA